MRRSRAALVRNTRGDDVRRALAQAAARIMVEHGIDDYGFAKRKAAERMGIKDQAVLPKNAEIEDAVLSYQRLFAADSHPQTLQEQRRAALKAMQLLRDFQPRLVGPVLTGSATPHQESLLHVFCDAVEAVHFHLIDAGIRFQPSDKRVRLDIERTVNCPSVSFTLNEFEIEAVVFASDGIRQAPLSPTDGRPMRRASISEVELLLDQAR